MEHFANDLKKQGCYKLCLETEEVNIGALRLYECEIKSSWILQRKILQELLSEWK